MGANRSNVGTWAARMYALPMTSALERFNAQTQARMASLVAGLGLVWAAKVGTGRLGIVALVNTPGLIELICFSILVWLVAKLRTAARHRPTS